MDHRVDAALHAHDAGDERAEERAVGGPELLALDLAAEAMRLELGNDGGKRRPAHVHLVERLNGAEPGRPALIGRPRRHTRHAESRIRTAIMASAARTAPPPLSEPETAALIALVERLAPRWIVSVHAPIGAILEPQPTPLGDALVAATGLPRLAAVRYRTTGVLDRWASERGLTCVTLELPKVTHDAAVVRFAPILAELLRGELRGG